MAEPSQPTFPPTLPMSGKKYPSVITPLAPRRIFIGVITVQACHFPNNLPLPGAKERRELLCSPCNARTTVILRPAPSLFASADPSSSDSKIRQVPDNQEVYLDTNGFTSLTFDITERVSHLSSDREALEYHFTDIVAEDDAKNICSIVENVDLPNFP